MCRLRLWLACAVAFDGGQRTIKSVRAMSSHGASISAHRTFCRALAACGDRRARGRRHLHEGPRPSEEISSERARRTCRKTISAIRHTIADNGTRLRVAPRKAVPPQTSPTAMLLGAPSADLGDGPLRNRSARHRTRDETVAGTTPNKTADTIGAVSTRRWHRSRSTNSQPERGWPFEASLAHDR